MLVSCLFKFNSKGDSQTIIYQISGKYRLNDDSRFLLMRGQLRWLALRDRVLNLLSFFDDYSLSWIPRRKNQLADRAAHKCLISTRTHRCDVCHTEMCCYHKASIHISSQLNLL